MNLSSGRRKPRIIYWLHLYLFICLLVSLPGAGQAQPAPDRKREFLERYARAHYPGRSGQIMLVPREGDFVTLNEPASLFMHGSPWSYDANIPLLFFGPPFIRRGTYADRAAQQGSPGDALDRVLAQRAQGLRREGLGLVGGLQVVVAHRMSVTVRSGGRS